MQAQSAKKIQPWMTWLLWALLAADLAAHLPGLTETAASVPLVVLSSFAFAVLHGGVRYGVKGITLFVLLCLAISFTLENLSILTGFPFGHYHYTDAMPGPRLFLVPVVIGLSYFGAGYAAWCLANIVLDFADADANPRSVLISLPIMAAFFMVMWDVGMDPGRSTQRQWWIWHDGGGFLGVPLSNYLGWFLTVFLFYAAFALFLGRQIAVQPVGGRTYWLQGLLSYALLPVSFLTDYLTVADTTLIDRSGTQWSSADIAESAVVVGLYTMVPMIVLGLIKLAGASRDQPPLAT